MSVNFYEGQHVVGIGTHGGLIIDGAIGIILRHVHGNGERFQIRFSSLSSFRGEIFENVCWTVPISKIKPMPYNQADYISKIIGGK